MKRIITFLFTAISFFSFSQDYENYTYRLTQSTSGFEIWTTTPANKILKSDAVPQSTDSKIKVYCAKNEFEPFQVIFKPTSVVNTTITMGDFGSGIQTEINRVGNIYLSQATDALGATGDFPDPLIPVENSENVNLSANENTAFWVTIYVPNSVTGAANYIANLTINEISIPIELHVFDFAISEELHVKSQMNFSHNAILDKYGVSGVGEEYWAYVDGIKQYFIDHRLTPKSVLWSGGLTSSGGAPYISYDCNGNWTDNDGIWGFELPAQRYLDGTGLMNGTFASIFNSGVGFPSFMCATFQNNDPAQDQRPSEFCGISRNGTWQNASSTYNQKWFEYITSMQNYLTSTGYLDKAYYYFANEPQDQADYDAIAWYSQELKNAAPNLKLMISEEPKPEIYNHSTYDAKIDIWLPVMNQYNPEISWQRETANNEETWIYFLHGTTPPYFNPITIDHQGVEAKFTGWFLWKYRIKGIAYYSVNSWSQNPWTNPMNSNQNGNLSMIYPPSQDNVPISYGANNHRFVPSIRFELIRDGFEDYEYLYVLANGQPEVNVSNSADEQVDKIIGGLTSYTRDAEFMYNLRRLIGLKNGGEISEIPDITPQAGHWRAQGSPGNYYINFQDPEGLPTTTSIETIYEEDYKFFNFENTNYLQIGTNDYHEALGYGWYAPNDVNWEMRYDEWFENGNELQKSQVYSDWGRLATFEFDLPNGNYNVTVGIGHRGTYNQQCVTVEGIVFYENATTSNSCLETTLPVQISDNKFTMEIGDGSEYTMLNFVKIEATETEINENLEKTYNIYPNPFSNFTTFKIEKSGNLFIYDLKGKIVFTEKISVNSRTKDLSSLNSGVYIYKIIAENEVVTGKIIKK